MGRGKQKQINFRDYLLSRIVDGIYIRFYDDTSLQLILTYNTKTKIYFAEDGQKGWAINEQHCLRKYLKPFVSEEIKEMDRDLDRISRGE